MRFRVVFSGERVQVPAVGRADCFGSLSGYLYYYGRIRGYYCQAVGLSGFAAPCCRRRPAAAGLPALSFFPVGSYFGSLRPRQRPAFRVLPEFLNHYNFILIYNNKKIRKR